MNKPIDRGRRTEALQRQAQQRAALLTKLLEAERQGTSSRLSLIEDPVEEAR